MFPPEYAQSARDGSEEGGDAREGGFSGGQQGGESGGLGRQQDLIERQAAQMRIEDVHEERFDVRGTSN